jgi:hypothetical protein
MKGRKQYSKVDDALLRDLRDILEDVYRVRRNEYERLPKRLKEVEELRPKEVEELRPREFITNDAVDKIQEDVFNGDELIGGGASGHGGTSEGDSEHGQNTSGENENHNSESDEDGYVYGNDESPTDGSELGNVIGDAYSQIPTSKERSLVPVWN